MFKNGTTKKELEQLGNSSTIIAQNAIIEGNIETSGNLRIEGRLIGNVSCKSKMAMGDASIVEGNIVSQNAEIAGKIKGQIEVTDLLLLKSTAIVDGDISAGKIIIEAGAVFNGLCKMGGAVKDINAGFRKTQTA